MKLFRDIVLTGILLSGSFLAPAQRIYSTSSVLSSGSWYKLGVKQRGVYKIDIPFLASLGVNTTGLSSNSVRLFGNGGAMLSEANAGQWLDDLAENSIQVVDGGDGVINGTDYILFYAPGPDEWKKDSVNKRFIHQKNLYSTESYYYLTIGGNGERVHNTPLSGPPAITVTSFSERFFHESDTINFLASGKEWYGEEFTNAPGKSLTRTFTVTIPDILVNTPLLLQSNCVARSVGTSSRFDIKINDQPAGQQLINSVGGGQYDLFVQPSTVLLSSTASQSNVSINYTYVPGSFNSQGWLNWFEIFARRNLSMNGVDQLLFRDWLSVGNTNAEFIVKNATSSTQVWEVTDPLHPSRMIGALSGTEFRFVNDCSRLREYIAFNNSAFLIPAGIGRINNQDLHNTSPADFLIVTHSSLLPQAQRLAQFHQQKNSLRVVVATTEQVFNEFGSGSPDPTAIRDFVKMYHDKYGTNTVDKLKYLLLFGDASFDYKDRINNNTNLVPSYQSVFSTDPLSTYASDDFFGFLDDNEDINSGLVINYLDIGIGRVPAKNTAEAKNFVDKVEAYFAPESFGPWRNNLTFIADDEDDNLHLQDAETITTTASSAGAVFNQRKIYLDAYQQESGAGGSRYPQANQAINNQIYNGTLIWNYNGHGGSRRLAEETVLDQDIVNGWSNTNRLPLFITATCDFAPYDNPTINSIGENILLRQKNGAIALMTTTRLVFAFSNRVMNNNYVQFALLPDANGKYRTLGEAVKEAKNYTYQTSGDIANNRKFTLLGDPAMSLAFPSLGVRATSVNGIAVSQADTLSTAEKIVIEGEVIDISGNVLSGFNGNVYPVVFDKFQTINTLGNDPGSPVTSFQTQNNILFKGKASVQNGRFTFSFKVPKDINFQYGFGRLSLYAENGTQDGSGLFTNFVVGGTGSGINNDNEGPEIKAWLNDEQFVNGGLANQKPVLLVKLIDSSGINTTGTGIGHDIVATLDNDNNQYFILNDYYQGELNSYQQGMVRFQLPELPPGPHSIKIKAWDVLNNSSEITLDFIVANDAELELSHVLNYPNPFTTNTRFWFEHNKPGQQLQVQLQVMTITGRIIKTIIETVNSSGNRVSDILWDGKDEYGDRPGRGVYLYKIRVISSDKKTKEVLGKLVIL
ncbi:MAG TPA: type IX secretion system sortase PorU [Chitinophagaceae bacterium]|nr:type IX secretion system sortase PorU [Chitinophagaceae bacterium]HNU14372.1 type IX secretion system sortase PorU [Chitinophagaceae bacterium]